MYHRHTASSNGNAPPQHQQQPYQFQRARSMGARPQSNLNRSYDGGSSTSFNNNNNMNTSYSSLPDTDENYYGKSSSNSSFSMEYDNKYNKRNGRSMPLQSFLVWRILPFLFLILLPWIPNQFVRSQVKSKKLALETVVQEQKDMVKELDQTTEKIKNLKREIESLHKDNELSYQELKHNGKNPGNLAAGDSSVTAASRITDMESDEYAKLEEEEEVLMNRINRLEKTIQKDSMKRVINTYGLGKYRFKVNLRDPRGKPRFFVIETAILAEMPHAIDHFLRMIEKKLWDGLALIHEAHSKIVTATPMLTDETHAWAGKRFADANLTHMAFTEHSPTYPPPHHRMFSVAFSGRPGGPGFYISLDNDLDYVHEQESTFGVVMEGRDVLYEHFLDRNMGYKRILMIESIDILPMIPVKARKQES